MAKVGGAKKGTKGTSKAKSSNKQVKQKASRKAFKHNVQAKMQQGKSKEQAIKESQAIQQRNK
jgi:hypothetical protein